MFFILKARLYLRLVCGIICFSQKQGEWIVAYILWHYKLLFRLSHILLITPYTALRCSKHPPAPTQPFSELENQCPENFSAFTEILTYNLPTSNLLLKILVWSFELCNFKFSNGSNNASWSCISLSLVMMVSALLSHDYYSEWYFNWKGDSATGLSTLQPS